MDFLPVSVRINGRKILIVGGGKVATHKAQILHRFTDTATVIAPEVSDELKQLPFTVIERPFEEQDLEGVQLLFVCTGDTALNHHIKELATRRHPDERLRRSEVLRLHLAGHQSTGR